jgi:hypothetical protein
MAKAPQQFAQDYYYDLDEQKRNDAVRRIAGIAIKDDLSALDLLDHVIECLSWCRDTRNQIMHSECYPMTYRGLEPSHTMTVAKRKSKRSPDIHYLHISLPELRSAVDFMHESKMLAIRFDLYLRFRNISEVPDEYFGYLTLPGKLIVPKPLPKTDPPAGFRLLWTSG